MRPKHYLVILSMVMLLFGCSEQAKVKKPEEQNKPPLRLNSTIGNLCNLYAPDGIAVEGFGLVANLNGNGSSECPTRVREYMIKYIQQMLGDANRLEAMRMLRDEDNAVVRVYGYVPAGARRGRKFDLFVEALPSTQTTSLKGGSLYTCNLTSRSRLGVEGAKILAKGKGPVFINFAGKDKPNLRKGYVIGGGKFQESNRLYIELKRPNYRLAAVIRNRINERFGEKTAKARSSQIVDLNLPNSYKQNYSKFANLVEALYLYENNSSLQSRIKILAKNLTEPRNPDIEYGLEAIGKPAVKTLVPYLKHEKPLVRLRAARCLVNMGYADAGSVLVKLAKMNPSPYKYEAIEAIGESSASATVKSLLREFLSDDDFQARLLAYKYLSEASDLAVMPKLTSAGFRIDTMLAKESEPLIYIKRKDQPRIALFGINIPLGQNVFLSLDKGNLLLDNPAGKDQIMMLRQHPDQKGVIGPIYADFNVESLISRLCDKTVKSSGVRSGLGLDFTEVVRVLNELDKKGAIKSKLMLGPLPDMPERANTIEKLNE
ncbi:flagellar basal body P-ring protein FlgI [Sedimentisphaera salicampi]|uniref:flagellar basal body P-ring protein FlgI n=1 Tax=Sedimentisphaera salicampi TaxID=1941349 RepID=UPI000B9AED3A|nr:flagellar basal body P-ring protein FlgI [Sedimentisphaera salicampi]OXU15079.1 Basal body P-ring protein [Sedimentisphaera salicampi]